MDMATSSIKKTQDLKFVFADGVAATINSRSAWVGNMSIDITEYTDQGYTLIGFLPQSASDYIVLGHRIDGDFIRVTAYNSYSSSQSVVIGGVAIFSK